MKASKGNKVYSIDESQKKAYIAQGFDIMDDKGNVLSYGAGKTVSYDKFKELEDKNAELEEENNELKTACEKLEKENKKLKEDLKKGEKGA
jgi:cell shape-determining protein MreC